jgi:hypothetical protein
MLSFVESLLDEARKRANQHLRNLNEGRVHLAM